MKKFSPDRVKLALTLFLSYFKIGLFTFGGGYAMIALIEREFVMRKKWINEVELYEIIAIAESTPGPIAINCATFVGYKILGFVGSFLATLAVCIPSFAIIYLISVFYDAFMSLTAVAYAFEGIKAGIAIMVTTAGINMVRKGSKNAFTVGVFLLTFAAAVCIDVFSLDFSTVYIILIGAAAGIAAGIVRDVVNKKKGVPQASDEKEKTDLKEAETGMAAGIICRDGNYSYGVGEELQKALLGAEKSGADEADKEVARHGKKDVKNRETEDTDDTNADITNTGLEKTAEESEKRTKRDETSDTEREGGDE